jgi:hypothetical protein
MNDLGNRMGGGGMGWLHNKLLRQRHWNLGGNRGHGVRIGRGYPTLDFHRLSHCHMSDCHLCVSVCSSPASCLRHACTTYLHDASAVDQAVGRFLVLLAVITLRFFVRCLASYCQSSYLPFGLVAVWTSCMPISCLLAWLRTYIYSVAVRTTYPRSSVAGSAIFHDKSTSQV